MVDLSIIMIIVTNMKTITTWKGDLGVLKAKCALMLEGFTTFTPDTDRLPYDLLVSKNNKFYKVQVKYREVEPTGSISVHFRNVACNTKTTKFTPVDKNQIDFYCIYCPSTDKCYFINHNNFNKSVTLKVQYDSKSNSKCNYGEDFLKPPV